MGLISGLAFGIVFGITFVVAFAYSGNNRSKQRADLAEHIASLSRMSVEDLRQLLPKQYFPPWVVFSSRQKLNWLNHELIKVWPFVNQATSELIKEMVEPILEQYKSSILASLKFSKLTLGTIAPQFTGITMIETGDSGATMEIEVQWDGNPNIILAVRTLLGVALPIQVKNVGFTGVFRLIFKPLVNELPCFGALTYSLLEKKKLDFTLKVIGGDIKSIPGLASSIEETIKDALEDSLMWPVRKVIPILPGDYRDLELRPVGVLEVKLVQAKNLSNKEFIGKSDPFCVLYVRPIRNRMKNSKTINNQLNPIWNEHFEFEVEDISTQHLVIKVFDNEGIQKAELMGCAQVKLKDLEPEKLNDLWLPLGKDLETNWDTKYMGEVHIELVYHPFGLKNDVASPFTTGASGNIMTSLEKAFSMDMNGHMLSSLDLKLISFSKRKNQIVRGVLSVIVKRAENLTVMDLSGKADPYVVIHMKKTDAKKKTIVIPKNLNPEWNQKFDFMVEDALHDLLIADVWDHDTFGKDHMGKCVVTLSKLLHEGEYDADFPLEGVKSGRLFLHLKWTPQPNYLDVLN